MHTRKPETKEREKLLKLEEDHFHDLKSARIAPAKLQETFVAFANADGGELYVGVEDKKVTGERIQGFRSPEAANDAIHTLLEETKPSVENVEVEFIDFGKKGLVLYFFVPKSPKVHYTTQEECYVRINARKKRLKGEQITQLGYTKGTYNYEKQPVDQAEVEEIAGSPHLLSYIERIETSLAPKLFLKKQKLLTKQAKETHPNVGCVLMFDEEPQATLDTRIHGARSKYTDYAPPKKSTSESNSKACHERSMAQSRSKFTAPSRQSPILFLVFLITKLVSS